MVRNSPKEEHFMGRYPDVSHPREGKARMGGLAYVYFDFSESSYSRYLEKVGALAGTNDEHQRYNLEGESFEHGVKAIIFSALCVEAAINDYGAWQLGDAYFSAHLNGLDVASKWVVVPRLICGKEINKAGPGYGALIALVRARHELIHNHSRDFKPSDPGLHLLIEKHAQKFNDQVNNAYRALLLLSLEFDQLVGPRFNPLPTLDKEISPFPVVPSNLLEVRAECKGIAARNRR